MERWVCFGDRLRFWRQLAGLSQAQLGHRLGYHHSQISKLESGFRAPCQEMPVRADALLGTDGELTAIWESAHQAYDSSSTRPFGLVTTATAGYLPLPVAAAGQVFCSSIEDTWPARLRTGCAPPSPAEAIATVAKARQRIRSSTPPAGNDPEILHAMMAMLTAYQEISRQQTNTEIAASVEHVLHTLIEWVGVVSGPARAGLLALCAAYAQEAGWLRMLRSQTSIGANWLHHGLRWAGATEDVTCKIVLLSSLSTLARMENDACTATEYARTMISSGNGRRWVAVNGHLQQARAQGTAGDLHACEQHVVQAQRLLSKVDERDRREAPWTADADGSSFVYSTLGASLRDVSALTGTRQVGLRAVRATKLALASLPARRKPSNLILTIRLADSYACAGMPDAAVAVVRPILADVTTCAHSLIHAELCGLRKRLLDRWSAMPEVKEFAEQIRGIA